MDDDKAPVPQDGRADLRARGDDGLLPSQREYFDLLSRFGTKELACAGLGIDPSRVTRWLRDDPAFLRAHENFFKGAFDATKARFQEMQESLPSLARDLMEAHKAIIVKHICTECGHKDDVSVDTTNDTVRARVWADMMKVVGQLKDVRKLEGEVNVTHLTAGQRIALERLRRGLAISIQQRRDLEDMGQLDGLKMYDGSEILEGEVLDAADD